MRVVSDPDDTYVMCIFGNDAPHYLVAGKLLLEKPPRCVSDAARPSASRKILSQPFHILKSVRSGLTVLINERVFGLSGMLR